MNKKFKVPNNTVRVITNLDGNYDVKDYDLESLANDPHPMIRLPINENMVTEVIPTPAEKMQNILDKTPVDPFIPYAMSLDPDNFLKKVELGIADIAPGKRLVTAMYEGENKHVPMTECAIIGDSYGPVGLFVPFCANINAIDEAADLLNDVYNNYENRADNHDMFVDKIIGRPSIKKLPF